MPWNSSLKTGRSRMNTVRASTSLLVLIAAACNSAQVETGGADDAERTVVESAETILISADEIERDEWGMREYVIAFLKAGPNRSQDSAAAAELQAAHMNNINRLMEEGSLVLAGPFLDGGELRGIFVFDVRTVEEAEALTATDPAIVAGRLTMELHPWYGTAALLKVNEIRRLIAPGD